MIDALELARELSEQDERLAAEIDAVAGLQRLAADVAVRSSELGEFEDRLAIALPRLEEELAEAEAELARREQAQREIDVEDEAERRRAEVRAADFVSMARRRIEHTREELAGLRARAAELPAELARLSREAAEVSANLPAHKLVAPEPDPAVLAEWASRARAALLVERSGLDTRRERVVREANELASAALGESVSTSVAGVRERLERHMLAP